MTSISTQMLDAFFNTDAGHKYLQEMMPTLDQCLKIDEECSKCRNCGSENDGFDKETLDLVLISIKEKFDAKNFKRKRAY
jgi:hypothetical protein